STPALASTPGPRAATQGAPAARGATDPARSAAPPLQPAPFARTWHNDKPCSAGPKPQGGRPAPARRRIHSQPLGHPLGRADRRLDQLLHIVDRVGGLLKLGNGLRRVALPSALAGPLKELLRLVNVRLRLLQGTEALFGFPGRLHNIGIQLREA